MFSSGFAEVSETGRAAQARMTGDRPRRAACASSGRTASASPTRRSKRLRYASRLSSAWARRRSAASPSSARAAPSVPYAYTLARERGHRPLEVDLDRQRGRRRCRRLHRLARARCGRHRRHPRLCRRRQGRPQADGRARHGTRGRASPSSSPRSVAPRSAPHAAASHTSALAGADAVYDAVLRQCGAYRAKTIEEFFDVGLRSLAARCRRRAIASASSPSRAASAC